MEHDPVELGAFFDEQIAGDRDPFDGTLAKRDPREEAALAVALAGMVRGYGVRLQGEAGEYSLFVHVYWTTPKTCALGLRRFSHPGEDPYERVEVLCPVKELPATALQLVDRAIEAMFDAGGFATLTDLNVQLDPCGRWCELRKALAARS